MPLILENQTQSISVATSSGELLPARTAREHLFLRNDSPNTVHIRFGTAAAVADATSIKLVSGAKLKIKTPGTTAIQAIALTATSNLTISETLQKTPPFPSIGLIPLLHMPLISDLSFTEGTGVATFTRSTVGTFIDTGTNLVTTAAIDAARFETNGILIEGANTNEALHNRDFTNVVHVKTNITAVKDATGNDGVANAASSLTATAANGTVFQTITKASAQNTFSIDVKRKIGTGTIEISDDGGTTFTDITASINSSTYSRFQITTTQVNPSFGVRIVTSGDAVEVDYEGLEILSFASSRIETTTASVTRTADNLSIPPSNIPAPTLAYSITALVDILSSSDSANHDWFNVAGENFRIGRSNTTANTIRMFHGGNASVDLINGDILSGQQRLTHTFDGTTFTLFQANVNKGSDSTFTPLTGTKTSVELGMRLSSGFLFGHLKDFKIFDQSLTADEESAL